MTDDVATMSLDDEMPWRPLFAKDDFYDDTGFSITAETDEHDIMLGNFFYTFQGGKEHPKSQWLGNGIVHNSLIGISPKERRGKGMIDNNFSGTGMPLAKFHDFDDVEVTRTDDAVIWKVGETVYTCRPPEWHLGGRAGEAEFDITFRQLEVPVVWSYGTREAAPAQGVGGGYCYIRADGNLRVAGTDYEIHNGRGVHERLVFCEGMDFIGNAAHDHDGYGTGHGFHIMDGDVWVWGLGAVTDPMFWVTVEGTEFAYLPKVNGATIKKYNLEPWHDPRSGMYLPSKWRFELESADGRLTLEVGAVARAYYNWELKNGLQMMYWHLCIANGVFTFPDGRRVPIVDRQAMHETVKPIFIHDQRMAGPNIQPMF